MCLGAHLFVFRGATALSLILERLLRREERQQGQRRRGTRVPGREEEEKLKTGSPAGAEIEAQVQAEAASSTYRNGRVRGKDVQSLDISTAPRSALPACCGALPHGNMARGGPFPRYGAVCCRWRRGHGSRVGAVEKG